MELESIGRGFYKTPGAIPVGQGLIIVHPFFHKAHVTPRYQREFVETVKCHKGPVVTFEESLNIDGTLERYGRLGLSNKPHFLINTENDDSRPPLRGGMRGWLRQSLHSWEDRFRFLRAFGQPFRLAGGGYGEFGIELSDYMDKYGIEIPGCLATLDRMLRHNGFATELVCTYVTARDAYVDVPL